jgi:hypothetical protein
MKRGMKMIYRRLGTEIRWKNIDTCVFPVGCNNPIAYICPYSNEIVLRKNITIKRPKGFKHFNLVEV